MLIFVPPYLLGYLLIQVQPTLPYGNAENALKTLAYLNVAFAKQPKRYGFFSNTKLVPRISIESTFLK